MLKLDNNLLEELGLGGLPEDQKRAMLQHIYETLELRVGTDLANQMTDQQLEEFEKFIDDGGDANQAQALQWLETNLSNYKQVVNQVFEQLKGEIKQMAPQIMAASAPAGHVDAPQAPVAPMAPPSTPDAAAPAMQQAPPVDYQPPVPAQGPTPTPPQPAGGYQQPAPGYQPAPQGYQPPQPPVQQPPQYPPQ